MAVPGLAFQKLSFNSCQSAGSEATPSLSSVQGKAPTLLGLYISNFAVDKQGPLFICSAFRQCMGESDQVLPQNLISKESWGVCLKNFPEQAPSPFASGLRPDSTRPVWGTYASPTEVEKVMVLGNEVEKWQSLAVDGLWEQVLD